MFEGAHGEAQDVAPMAEHARLGMGEVVAGLVVTETLLAGYLDSLGATGVQATFPQSVAKSPPVKPGRSPTWGGVGDAQVTAARERVGEGVTRAAARGEWLHPDAPPTPVASGKRDDAYDAAYAHLVDRFGARVARLATHMEVKLSIALHGNDEQQATLVIDRRVCGTTTRDENDSYTCDKYLSRILPTGKRLRVIESTGRIRIYEGEGRR